jgi:hypothetical protein
MTMDNIKRTKELISLNSLILPSIEDAVQYGMLGFSTRPFFKIISSNSYPNLTKTDVDFFKEEMKNRFIGKPVSLLEFSTPFLIISLVAYLEFKKESQSIGQARENTLILFDRLVSLRLTRYETNELIELYDGENGLLKAVYQDFLNEKLSILSAMLSIPEPVYTNMITYSMDIILKFSNNEFSIKPIELSVVDDRPILNDRDGKNLRLLGDDEERKEIIIREVLPEDERGLLPDRINKEKQETATFSFQDFIASKKGVLSVIGLGVVSALIYRRLRK